MDNKETLNLFPQPVFKYKVSNFKEYNEKLSEYIYNLNSEDKEGVQRSNRGGWHSNSFKLKDTNNPDSAPITYEMCIYRLTKAIYHFGTHEEKQSFNF